MVFDGHRGWRNRKRNRKGNGEGGEDGLAAEMRPVRPPILSVRSSMFLGGSRHPGEAMPNRGSGIETSS